MTGTQYSAGPELADETRSWARDEHMTAGRRPVFRPGTGTRLGRRGPRSPAASAHRPRRTAEQTLAINRQPW